MKFELRKTARGLSDEKLLEDLRRVARKLGRDTVTIAEYTEHGLGHASTIQRRFGSWFKALEDAGLKPSRSRINISDEELFANLQTVWMSLGPRLFPPSSTLERAGTIGMTIRRTTSSLRR